jgi:hypothetical protein
MIARTTLLQRSLTALKAEGYHAEKVRRWRGSQRTSHRLFHFIDLLAFRADQAAPLAVHVTTAARSLGSALPFAPPAALAAWLAAGGRLEVWAWRKLKRRWSVDRRPVTPADVARWGKAQRVLQATSRIA